MRKLYTIFFILTLFCLDSCSPEQDIPANQNYGKDEHIKIMKFYADWCGPCQAMKPEYEKVKKLYPYIQFEEINFDKDKEKVTKYSINSIPLTIKSKDGSELKRKVGYMSRNDLIQFIEN